MGNKGYSIVELSSQTTTKEESINLVEKSVKLIKLKH